MPILWQPIGGGLAVPTTAHCAFTADAILLARFAAALPTDTACDLGAGSGIIPLWWCRRDPPAHITALEREAAFVSLLTAAAARFSLQDRLTVIEGDWADETLLPPSSMTLVTCNPPYFKKDASRKSPDPLRAAARQEDHPALLSVLCAAAARLLTDAGRFCLCHRPERLPDVLAALSAAGLVPRRLQSVQTTKEAPARLVLVEAGKSGTLRILPPLVEHQTGHATAVYAKRYDRDVT